MKTRTKNCPRCGGMLIAGPYGSNQWECHNDQCDLNREGLKKLELIGSIDTGLRLGCFLPLRLIIIGALIAGASYGFYLLLWR